jgi:hypothetical protein
MGHADASTVALEVTEYLGRGQKPSSPDLSFSRLRCFESAVRGLETSI